MSTHCDKCGEPWLPLKRDLSPWLSYCFNCGNEGPFCNDVLAERQRCTHVFDETDDGKTICSLCGVREMDMTKCGGCGTYHYGNDPCPHRKIKTFDKDAWCVVHLLPNSDVVQVTSNIADRDNARRYAEAITHHGGYVFHVIQANMLVAALYLAKGNTIHDD